MGPEQHLRAAPSFSVKRPHVPCPLFQILFPKRLPGWRDRKKFTPLVTDVPVLPGPVGKSCLQFPRAMTFVLTMVEEDCNPSNPRLACAEVGGEGCLWLVKWDCLSKGYKDTALPLGFGQEAGGRLAAG